MTHNLTQQYTKHLDSIIKMYQEADREMGNILSNGAAYGIITRSKAAVETITGSNSYYTKDIMTIANESFHTSHKVELIIGILAALRGEIQDGYLISISELVRGETFNNYLEMAEHLISEGFKDAAAVIAGSTLEAHLRQLCVKHGVDTTSVAPDNKVKAKKASQLNQELGKVAYSSFDQKQINAWQNLRNDAAHGNYDAYSNKQVELFIDWLSDFIAKNPA